MQEQGDSQGADEAKGPAEIEQEVTSLMCVLG